MLDGGRFLDFERVINFPGKINFALLVTANGSTVDGAAVP